MSILRAIGDLPYGGGFGVLVVVVFAAICVGIMVNQIIADWKKNRRES